MRYFLLPLAGVAIGLVLGRLSAIPALLRLRAERDELRRRVETDPLAGLPGRIAAARAYNERDPVAAPFAIALIAMEYSGEIQGAPEETATAGSLAAFATKLSFAAAPFNAFVAHLDGDTFVVLLPCHNMEHTTEELRELLSLLAVLTIDPMTANGDPPIVDPRLCAGLTLPTLSGANWSRALRQANIALRRARATGLPLVTYAPTLIRATTEEWRARMRGPQHLKDRRPDW